MSSPVIVTRIQNRRGTQTQFEALYPPGYDGIGGFGSISGYNLTNYPGVLLSGELALCTDSRRIFLGNINGEYVELANSGGTGILAPLTVTLAPVGSFTTIPALTYNVTPFYTIQYSITDNTGPDWNLIGPAFSRNGDMKITAVTSFTPAAPVAPFPAVTPVNLTDTFTEINTVLPNTISFQAIYNGGNTQIQIQYRHNFSGSVKFNTSSIKWIIF